VHSLGQFGTHSFGFAAPEVKMARTSSSLFKILASAGEWVEPTSRLLLEASATLPAEPEAQPA
jgi:hypothetical protein